MSSFCPAQTKQALKGPISYFNPTHETIYLFFQNKEILFFTKTAYYQFYPEFCLFFPFILTFKTYLISHLSSVNATNRCQVNHFIPKRSLYFFFYNKSNNYHKIKTKLMTKRNTQMHPNREESLNNTLAQT